MSDQDQIQAVDLLSCEKELIHIPGSVQPYGILLAVKDGVILGASENINEMLGVSTQEILGKLLKDYIDTAAYDQIQNAINLGVVHQLGLIQMHWNARSGKKRLDGIIQQNIDGYLILELELTEQAEFSMPLDFYNIFRTSVTTIQNSLDSTELSQNIVKMVRSITGFDHVMLYQFDTKWHGRVLAEDRDESRPIYEGHHFPASDIPPQARQLYLLNWVRYIPDVNYCPSVISLKDTTKPLDLTYSALRAVSPLHIEYLKNMNVGASMSISIKKEGRLWGLIACHHSHSVFLPYNIRTACSFLGQVFSLELNSKEQQKLYIERLESNKNLSCILEYMALEDNVTEGLFKDPEGLIDLMRSQGVALFIDNQLSVYGQTPDKGQIKGLIEMLNKHRKKLFFTDSLSEHYPPAEGFKDSASGIIFVSIPKSANDCIIWFRPEYVRDLIWAGNPQKAISYQDGNKRISPRESFASWKETLKLQSLPWEMVEIEAAHEIYDLIANCILKKIEADNLRINQEVDKRTENINTENKKLEALNKMMINRELVMVKLKKEIDVLLQEMGRPPKYEIIDTPEI